MSALTVTVLGCSGTWAGPGGACSGYLVRSASTSIWVDAGPGTLGALLEHVDLADLDALLLSHHHPDHWMELPVVRNACKYGLGISGFTVHGTPPTHGLADGLFEYGLGPTVDWHDRADGDRVTIGDIDVRFAETDHIPSTLSMAFSTGDSPVLGYSADTGPDWSFAALGGVDVALCEASLDVDREGAAPHLSARQAAVAAREGGASRLLLTHLTPGTDRARRLDEASEFPGEITAVTAGTTYRI